MILRYAFYTMPASSGVYGARSPVGETSCLHRQRFRLPNKTKHPGCFYRECISIQQYLFW